MPFSCPAAKEIPAAGGRRAFWPGSVLGLLILLGCSGCAPGPESRLIGVWHGTAEPAVEEREQLELWLDSLTLRVPNSHRIAFERNLTRDGKSWQETDSGSWTLLQDRNDKMIIEVHLQRADRELKRELAITFTGPDEIHVREEQWGPDMPPLVLKRTSS